MTGRSFSSNGCRGKKYLYEEDLVVMGVEEIFVVVGIVSSENISQEEVVDVVALSETVSQEDVDDIVASSEILHSR